jgi:nucleoside permease NupC
MFSYIFFPIAILMGVDVPDCRNVAMLMGYRLTLSNFLSMLKVRVNNEHVHLHLHLRVMGE